MADDPTTQFDQATFLAHRAIDAATLPDAPVDQIALPGAKAAISQEHLRAYQDAGHDQHAIAARINERWADEHADRLAAHRQWVAGPYAGALEQLRREQMEQAAEELRRRALWEQLTAQRED